MMRLGEVLEFERIDITFTPELHTYIGRSFQLSMRQIKYFGWQLILHALIFQQSLDIRIIFSGNGGNHLHLHVDGECNHR